MRSHNRPRPGMNAQAYNSRMKGLTAAALAVAIALPACGQHGGGGQSNFGGHGASSAPPASGFHGGFTPSHGGVAPSAPMHYSGSTIAHVPTPYPSSMRLLAPGVRYPITAPIIRPGFYHPDHGHPGHGTTVTTTHNFVIHTYPVYPYAYPSYVYGYLPADLLDDSFNNNEQPQPQPQPEYGSAYPQPMLQPDGSYAQPAPQPEYGYPQAAPQPEYGYAYPQPVPAPEGAYAYPAVPSGYVPQPAPVAPQMQYVPGSASTVILIYKDGRPPEEIQNYLATRSTLTVLDGGRRREIPLSDLNISATVSANHQTGVDFELPTPKP